MVYLWEFILYPESKIHTNFDQKKEEDFLIRKKIFVRKGRVTGHSNEPLLLYVWLNINHPLQTVRILE